MKKLVQKTAIVVLTAYCLYAAIIVLSGLVPGLPGPPRLPFGDPQALLASAGLLPEKVEQQIDEARKSLDTRRLEAEQKAKEEAERLEAERKKLENEAEEERRRVESEGKKLWDKRPKL